MYHDCLGSIRDLIILFFSVNSFCKNTISYEGRLYFYSHSLDYRCMEKISHNMNWFFYWLRRFVWLIHQYYLQYHINTIYNNISDVIDGC